MIRGHASEEQRAKVEFGRSGLHWEEIDEDISVAGLMPGVGDLTRPTPIAVYPALP